MRHISINFTVGSCPAILPRFLDVSAWAIPTQCLELCGISSARRPINAQGWGRALLLTRRVENVRRADIVPDAQFPHNRRGKPNTRAHR